MKNNKLYVNSLGTQVRRSRLTGLGRLGVVAARQDGVVIDTLGLTLLLRGEAVAIALAATVSEGPADALVWVIVPLAESLATRARIYWQVADI